VAGRGKDDAVGADSEVNSAGPPSQRSGGTVFSARGSGIDGRGARTTALEATASSTASRQGGGMGERRCGRGGGSVGEEVVACACPRGSVILEMERDWCERASRPSGVF
jgi:hypothetical protein